METPHGLTLTYMKYYIDNNGGRDAFLNLTTDDVCTKFVKPTTFATQTSLVDYVTMQPGGDKYVRPAKWFVSHAWSYVFVDVVDALENFMQDNLIDESTTGLWFCAFNNNQHEAVLRPFSFWFTTFKDALAEIGNVVMVFSPWNNPITLTRTWCVFEVYTSIVTNSRFEIAMGRAQTQEFLEDVRDGTTFQKLSAKVNSALSKTTVACDREQLFAIIEKEIGFAKLDRMVFSALEKWVIQMIENRIKKSSEKNEMVEWQLVLADIYGQKFEYALADEILEHAVTLEQIERALRLRALSELAVSRARQQKPVETWDHLFVDALSLVNTKEERILVLKHSAEAYYAALDFSRSLEISKEAYEIGINFPEDKNVLENIMSGIGMCLMYLHRLREAEEWLIREREYLVRTVGPDHMHTITAENTLAACYGRQGKYSHAKSLFQSNYMTRLRTLGPDAALTKLSLVNMTCSELRLGQYENIEGILIQCKEYFKAKQDRLWENICDANLGEYYLHVRDYKLASEYLEMAYAQEMEYSPTSPFSIQNMYFRYLVALDTSSLSLNMISLFEKNLHASMIDGKDYWYHWPCQGCLISPIQGEIFLCPQCPRISLRFCRPCVENHKYDHVCQHQNIKWIVMKPIPRVLHETRLHIYANDGNIKQYQIYWLQYDEYCKVNNVIDRMERHNFERRMSLFERMRCCSRK